MPTDPTPLDLDALEAAKDTTSRHVERFLLAAWLNEHEWRLAAEAEVARLRETVTDLLAVLDEGRLMRETMEALRAAKAALEAVTDAA